MSQALVVLHLSDLHIRCDESETIDRRVVLDPLIERVKKDKKAGLAPEIVVVSGDIAFQGIAAEYKLAGAFFTDLLYALGLPPDRLFIVPGNHDVNRPKYRPSDVPRYKNLKQLNDELANAEFRADLLKGMASYFDFARERCPHFLPIDTDLVPFVAGYPAACGKTVQLIGLNSAWMCRKPEEDKVKDWEKGDIAIGDWQVRRAMDVAGGQANDLRIFVFHHPLSWLWPEDTKRVKGFLANAVVLCGHLHEPAGGFYHELDGAYHLFQAGGAYLGSESAWPSRYHYLTLDWDTNKLSLVFRSFDKRTGRWGLDGATGDDGHSFFDLPALKPEPAGPIETPLPKTIS